MSHPRWSRTPIFGKKFQDDIWDGNNPNFSGSGYQRINPSNHSSISIFLSLEAYKRRWFHGGREREFLWLNSIVTLANWGMRLEARKIKERLRKVVICKLFDYKWKDISFPLELCIWMFKCILFEFMLFWTIWSRERFVLLVCDCIIEYVDRRASSWSERSFEEWTQHQKAKDRGWSHFSLLQSSLIL